MKQLLFFAFLCNSILSFAQKSSPFVLGSTVEISSTLLSEKRILNIYLPEGYQQHDTVTYPVIYLLDGGKEEDFIHVVGLVQFYNFEWIHRVPKSIVVGIANTDRKRDFTFPSTVAEETKQYPTTGSSAKFIQFIEQELKPFIQETYKTNDDAMLIGESLGGLLATEILFKKPLLFNRYLIVSPSLWWSNGQLLNETMPAISRPTDVYIAVGKEGLTPSKPPRVMEVDANLLADKLYRSEIDRLKVYFDYLPEEDHATIAHQAVMNGFKYFYPKEK